MKRRVTFDLNPKIKEFYKDEIIYDECSNNMIIIYIIGAIFVTFMINKYK